MTPTTNNYQSILLFVTYRFKSYKLIRVMKDQSAFFPAKKKKQEKRGRKRKKRKEKKRKIKKDVNPCKFIS